LLTGSILEKGFSDQRPEKGITDGAYATDGLDFGDARSRQWNLWDDME
jgi:hypothetical protein